MVHGGGIWLARDSSESSSETTPSGRCLQLPRRESILQSTRQSFGETAALVQIIFVFKVALHHYTPHLPFPVPCKEPVYVKPHNTLISTELFLAFWSRLPEEIYRPSHLQSLTPPLF